ncbi:MAG: hypothetical protein RJA70_3132 [Pseudomonadota bacterium]|jgi:predicted DsbA family dithiol-disulfide isomerase/uncharacterized membrane protein
MISSRLGKGADIFVSRIDQGSGYILNVLQNLWLTLYRICALGAILFSALLYLHYLSPVDSGFCSEGGGCETVRSSGFSYFGSRYVNIPLVGVIAYAALFSASLFSADSPVRRYLHWPSVAGGVAALGLVITQALYLKAFCWMCVVVDSFGVGLAFLSLLAIGKGPAAEPLRRWAWLSLLGAALVLPAAWAWLKPLPPVPEAILALYKPGKINVVEFADFQCPYCLTFHPRLKRVVEKYGDQVHFVRRHMPLLQHQFAERAAFAAVCAEAQGQGENMADKLFRTPIRAETISKLATELKLDLPAFESCLKSDTTVQRIEADRALLSEAGFQGLPTTYVGNQVLVGLKATPVIEEAFELAAKGDQPQGIPASLFLALCALVVLGVGFAGRNAD